MVTIDRETAVLSALLLAMACEPPDIQQRFPKLWLAVAQYMGPHLARGTIGKHALQVQVQRDTLELLTRLGVAVDEEAKDKEPSPPADDYEIRDLLAAAADMEPSSRGDIIKRMVPMLVARVREAESAPAITRDEVEYLIGFQSNQEAMADAIGEEEMRRCVDYHARRVKLWEAFLAAWPAGPRHVRAAPSEAAAAEDEPTTTGTAYDPSRKVH